ncbi:glycosyltransferase [Saccharothrix sp. NRRL B-16314]|uniref:glycosyltransferase n=1 Tax=Saccharothrix sp. NRRL B-16314 TaxID=1463825 RepID=UPI0005267730|nr:glycosyltransferase [Saccharothrix sp. NRRL B-16314]
MKVLVLTLGTRGDVQPFLELARGLRAAGHDALVAAPHRFTALADGFGVPFTGVDDGPLRVMDDDRAGEVIEGGLRVRLRQMREMPGMFTKVLEDCWAVAMAGAPFDLVVHNGQIIAGQHVAEALGVPAVLGLPLPLYVPTSEFRWPGAPLPAGLPGALNRATYLGMKMPAVTFGGVVDKWREGTLGLPLRRGRHDPTLAVDGTAAPVLHAFSPAVIPRPADWPESALTTGYWAGTGGTPLPARVEEFLAAGGGPPVSVGFGSMIGSDPARLAEVVVEAARRVGVRPILAAGWGALAGATSADDVLVVDEIDYRGLFPRVAAVVHHGGAGTTGAAFTAGRPQVVCPFVADQPFWGEVAHRRGVGAAPVPQRRLTVDRLAAALDVVVGNEVMARTARELGERVRAEDGVGTAVAALERIVQ